MPPRRGEGGRGSNVEFTLQQGLRELLERVERNAEASGSDGSRGRAMERRGGPRGGGSVSRATNASDAARTRGSSGAGAGERRPQLGDWTCRGCGFSPNFARRRNCFSCRRQRSPRGDGSGRGEFRGGGGGGLSHGPVNANGLRPILGKGSTTGWGKADEAPTHRVPGASVAARAQASALAGSRGTVVGAAGGAARTTPAGAGVSGAVGTNTAGRAAVQGKDLDEDGFQVVRGRGRKGGAATGTHDVEGGPNTTTSCEPGGECAGEASAAADKGEPSEGDNVPSPSELHQEWQEEVALVKRLRQQGLPAEHPVMAAACGSRDQAEKRWRDAKDPTPATVLLGRAQTKLDKAIALQAESRQALIDHERAYKERLAVLQAKLEEDAERVRLRRRQLEEVHGQLGGGASAGGIKPEQGAAVMRVHGTICNEVAPALAALAEQLDSSTPAWTTLNGLLSSLADSKTLLEQAVAPQGAQTFDIGDEVDGHHGDDGCHGDGAHSDWSESHEVDGWGGDHDGHARHQRNDRQDDDQSMGTGDWWDSSQDYWHQHQSQTARWAPCGHGKWSRSSWADSWEQEQADREDDAVQPAAARRRLEPRADAAGDAAADGSGTTVQASQAEVGDVAQRRQLHEQRVAKVIECAINAGVQPLTKEGEELQMLDASQLVAWAKEHLPAHQWE